MYNFIWLLYLGLSCAVDGAFINQDELINEIPSGCPPANYLQLSQFVNEDDKNYILFDGYMAKGYTAKGLTFNIYDESMRNATIALFYLLKYVKINDMEKFKCWAEGNINHDMFLYVCHLLSLFNEDYNQYKYTPPFILKPNYFILGETLYKALLLKLNGINNRIDISDNIPVNANYSGWNLQENQCDEDINYFREDVSLNSYYYGMHLLHPFWMSNKELDELNKRHAEHYYFNHKQLIARYLLEKAHLKRDISISNKCEEFNSYLVYKNGLPIPIRKPVQDKRNDLKLHVKSINVGMQELISRNIVFLADGGVHHLTNENHIDLLARFIREQLDSISSANIVRSLYGYGDQGYLADTYNPAPSIFHNPETSLRDPIYWHLIQLLLQYVTDFQNNLEPYDLSEYHTEDITIFTADFSQVTTYFEYYQTNLERLFQDGYHDQSLDVLLNFNVTARQKRLNHYPFSFDFEIGSKRDTNAAFRLFMGPACSIDECWKIYNQFYLLDSLNISLSEGLNLVSWCPWESSKFSDDKKFNFETPTTDMKNLYNLFKFPKNLAIPKGLKEGQQFSLFVIVTPSDDVAQNNIKQSNHLYTDILYEVDDKPLGFPFHRKPTMSMSKESAFNNNIKFYNVTVYHRSSKTDVDYFSSHLE